MRTGVHLAHAGRGILIDTPPELRIQCLAHGVERVDAVFYTHAHADHVMGLDDLRRFNWMQRAPITCHGPAAALKILGRSFPWAFRHDPSSPTSAPMLKLQPINGPVTSFGFEVIPIPIHHGETLVFGYRIGRFAFLSDCNAIPAASRPLLENLDVLVLDALRPAPHPTHFSLDQAVEEAHRIGARRTYFTHMTHELKHAETEAKLPDGMALAYDGLEFTW